jgi:hypothetical protein
VLALRAEVGEAGHIFALRRASLLADGRKTAPQDAPEMKTLPLPERIRHTGFAAIARCLADAGPALLAALALVLPGDFAGHIATQQSVSADAASGEWPLLRTLLCKELDPAWSAFFS